MSFLKEIEMSDNEIMVIAKAIDQLGYPTTIMGILRAKRDGIINPKEYNILKEKLHSKGLPSDWWRVLVFKPVV